MSEFKLGLAAAKKRQHVIYASVTLSIAAAALLLVGFLLSAGGTPIIAAPEDAQKTARVHVVEGTAFVLDNVVYSLSSTFTIKLSADGFHTAERAIEKHEKGQNVTVILTELPALVSMASEPELDNTRWLVDDVLVHVGLRLQREFIPGSYAISIDNPYFQVATVKLDAKRAEKIDLKQPLQAVAGALRIKATPDDAEISVNGDVAGTGHVDQNLPGGAYVIKVSHDGYETTEEKIEVTHAVPVIERSYRLKPVSAYLTVFTKPEGGQLLLNGRRINAGTRYEIEGNAQNNITYFKEGYQAKNIVARVKPGGNDNVMVELVADIGKVEVKSDPPADVYLHGQKVATTPTQLNLPAVPIDIELRKDGYRTVKRHITPSSKSTIVINERLQTEKAARLAEQPAVYKNSIGIVLKRFQPTTFVMGAPRGQLGQRANEFEKKVILNRIFYAGLQEVTNAQFQQFSGKSGGSDSLPVANVTWIDAAKFCNWLSAKENRSPFYVIAGNRLEQSNEDSDGYRLLSEAEWEWLARMAGKQKQTIFPWGDDSIIPKNAGNIADEQANGLTKYYVPNYNDGHAGLAPVGSYPAEASGLFDLTGNASEWVHDYYSLMPPNKGETFTNPLGPETGDAHTYKGANFRSGTRTELRAAYRNGSGGSSDVIGFRIGRYLNGGKNAQ
jgi:formylglycine-generating enzyme required for sulfatase activity